MKKYASSFVKRALQVLVISLVAFSMDRLIVLLSHDDSIWLGEAIEVVGSVIFGPLTGFLRPCSTAPCPIFSPITAMIISLWTPWRRWPWR